MFLWLWSITENVIAFFAFSDVDSSLDSTEAISIDKTNATTQAIESAAANFQGGTSPKEVSKKMSGSHVQQEVPGNAVCF